jgi:protein phosphatase
MIPVRTSHLQVAAITDPGAGGKNNEDRYAVSAFKLSEKDPTPVLLAIIADGVGGHRAGEVAAELAITRISQVVASSDAIQPLTILQTAFEQANQSVYAQALVNPDLSGMGTTGVCAWVIADRLYTASVGDSRIYLVRADEITQLTIDHTWVQEALDSGLLTPEQARNHPNAHVIRRHIGTQQPIVPDFRLRMSAAETDARSQANQGLSLLPGDIVMLCSDGLTDLVSNAEIGAALSSFNLSEALQKLVDLANERGGHDNISIVAIQVPRPRLKQAPPVKNRRIWLWIGLLSLLALGIFLFGAYRYWLTRAPQPMPTASPSLAPVIVPTLIPTGTSLEATPALSPTQAGPVSLPSATAFPQESPSAGQATYTPWPTSTGQGAVEGVSP